MNEFMNIDSLQNIIKKYQCLPPPEEDNFWDTKKLEDSIFQRLKELNTITYEKMDRVYFERRKPVAPAASK